MNYTIQLSKIYSEMWNIQSQAELNELINSERFKRVASRVREFGNARDNLELEQEYKNCKKRLKDMLT